MSLTPVSYFVLRAIIRFPRTPNNVIPLQALADAANVSYNTAQRHVKTLHTLGLVKANRSGKELRVEPDASAYVMLNNAGLL